MKLYKRIDVIEPGEHTSLYGRLNENFKVIEKELNKLSYYVMESKKFEKVVWISILIFYCYIGLHVGLWIGELL